MQITPFCATPSLSYAVCWAGWKEHGDMRGEMVAGTGWVLGATMHGHWIYGGGTKLCLIGCFLVSFCFVAHFPDALSQILGGAMPSAHWVMPSCAMGLSKLLYLENVSQGACRQACLTTSACCHFFVIERWKLRHNDMIFHINSICYLKEIEWICFDRLAKYRSWDAR